MCQLAKTDHDHVTSILESRGLTPHQDSALIAKGLSFTGAASRIEVTRKSAPLVKR